ncbi:MAG: hypothetical protein KIS66_00605 [Fimbriimonadaceae bacterium]|nr:hypothetical protein [Fimbriimonadaceae bacterium]
MNAALRSLSEGLFDYAGLFPPARLSVVEALGRYRAMEDDLVAAHLVDRFVCPTLQIAEVAEAWERLDPEETLRLAAIGTVDEGPKLDFKRDAEAIAQFAGDDRVAIEAYERPYAPSLTPQSVGRQLPEIEVFFEIPIGGDAMREAMDALVDAGAGAKVRTGGLRAAAFPTALDLADFLAEAVDLALEFKMTAGLHHLARGVYSTDGPGSETATMHGFLNVVMATALLDHADYTREEACRVLERVAPFEFVGDMGGNGDIALTAEQFEATRELFRSIGSCSIDEPIADLRAAGLL